uniref:Uncharacterized protein n=1 Tax=Strongyloides stercoralis TaxID=6248 RepID=A0A0K0EH99_STRER
MINRYQWNKQDFYLLSQVASLKSILKNIKENNQNNKYSFPAFTSVIDPNFISNDWTSLSVICFGICELSIRCLYNNQKK